MRRAAAAAVLAGVLALTGCAAGAAHPAASPSGSAAAPSARPLRTPLPATVASAAPVTLDVHRAGAPAIAGPLWSTAAAGDSSVTVQWAGAASDACGAVDGAYVTETAAEVVIALGAHAREPGRVCPLVLVPHAAVVTLAAPLGARRLLEPSVRLCGPPVRTSDGTNDGAGRTCPVRPAP